MDRLNLCMLNLLKSIHIKIYDYILWRSVTIWHQILWYTAVSFWKVCDGISRNGTLKKSYLATPAHKKNIRTKHLKLFSL